MKKTDDRQYFALTLTQQDIYFDQLRSLDSPLYNVGGYIEFPSLDLQALRNAHAKVIASSDAFGIRIVDQNAEVNQYISADRTTELPLVDLSDSPRPEEHSKQWLKELFEKVRDIDDSELFEAYVLKLSSNRYFYVGYAHHLIMDGWGFANWARLLGEHYSNQCLSEKQIAADEEVGSPYTAWRDIVAKDQSYASGKMYERDKRFWKDYLNDVPVDGFLRNHHQNRVLNASSTSRRTVVEIDPSDVAGVSAYADDHGLSLPQTYLSLFCVCLSQMYDKADYIIGVPSHNRKGARQKGLIGVFTSVSPVRVEIDNQRGFAEICSSLLSQQKRTLRHQRYPMSHLQTDGLLDKAQRNGYEISFNYLVMDSDAAIGGLDSQLVYLSHNHEMTPLAVTFWHSGDSQTIKMLIDFNLDYFTSGEIDLLAERLLVNFRKLIADDQSRILDLWELPASEMDILERHSLRRRQIKGVDSDFVESFTASALIQGKSLAVTVNDDQYTYEQLLQRTGAVAERLRAVLSGDGQHVVAVLLDRSIDMMVAILAILRAGHTILPLNSASPNDRQRQIVRQAGASLVVTGRSTTDSDLFDGCPVFPMDGKLSISEAANRTLQGNKARGADETAYVIFTSGSTGRPKGVAVSYGALSSHIDSVIDLFGVSSSDVVLSVSAFGFDTFFEQILAALSCGAHCVISHEDPVEPGQFFDYVGRFGVTVSDVTPAYLALLLDNTFARHWLDTSLRALVVGGEATTTNLIGRWFDVDKPDHCTLYNAYGPTEGVITAAVRRVTEADKSYVRIGCSIGERSLYVLDAHGRRCPVGVAGELHISGPCIAQGYLNEPALTSQSFISSSIDASVVYRTGDIVWMDEKGDLVFVGRRDEQIKLRGYRIELGEVVEALTNCAVVQDGTVVLVPEEPGKSSCLVAYALVSEGISDDQQALIARITCDMSERIPSYMMPSKFVLLDDLPLTASGKIDKRKLPNPVRESVKENVRTASTPTETIAAEIWGQLFDIDVASLDVEAGFFELGGDSISAMKLIADLNDTFSCKLTIRALFEDKTLQNICARIDSSSRDRSRRSIESFQKNRSSGPLSAAQQRLWFIDKLNSGSSEYNMSAAFDVAGQFDVAAAEASLNTIIASHRIFRTHYKSEKNHAVQVASDQWNFHIEQIRFTAEPDQNFSDELDAVLGRWVAHQFDLGSDLLMRACYVTYPNSNAGENGVFLIQTHHIASDGWSIDLLIQEFQRQYNAKARGLERPVLNVAVDYIDYACWQQDYLKTQEIMDSLEYWKSHLSGIPSVHRLPLDFDRPLHKRSEAKAITTQIDGSVIDGLEHICQRFNVTRFMLIHAALGLLMTRFTDDADVVVGTPAANRYPKDVERTIGFFANSLVLRTSSDFIDLSGYLDHVKSVNLDALDNQQVPFEMIVEHMNVDRATGHSPLFQVLLTVNDDKNVDLELEGLAVSPRQFSDSRHVKFDLEVSVQRNGAEWEVEWLYDVGLFSEVTVRRFATHFQQVLTRMVRTPEASLEKLNALSMQESDYLVKEMNAHPIGPPEVSAIFAYFDAQVERHPNRIAVAAKGVEYSYQDLSRYADRVACAINVHHDAKSIPRVGVCLERSVDMLAVVLGVLKSGGAYIPLDPSYPEERIDYIAKDASLSMLITSEPLLDRLSLDNEVVRSITVEQIRQMYIEEAGLQACRSGRTVEASDLAYIIYTSGSTGFPKGVAVTHGNACALIHWARNTYSNEELSRVLASTSLNFDLSVFELFVPISTGNQCVIVNDVLDLLENPLNVTLINTVPSAINTLLDQDGVPSEVQVVNLAGEPLSKATVNRLLGNKLCNKVYNLYGPSEDTTYSTFASFSQPIDDAPSIGKVIANSEAYVLSSQRTLMPYGCVGELYLGGHGVTSGYWNKPELTQERYVTLPFAPGTLYQTGDRVKYLPDGNLMFLGRNDGQVKIRGYRIELSEVEIQLASIECVKDCAVVIRDTNRGDRVLQAFIEVEQMPSGEGDEYVAQIKRQLAEKLPAFMIPGELSILDRLPLTPNGKIDRKELASRELYVNHQLVEAPIGAVETNIAELFARIIDIDLSQVGRLSNFFDLGGHSLLVVQLASELRATFACDLSVRDVFTAGSVSEIALLIESAPESPGLSSIPVLDPRPDRIPLSSPQQSLWYLAQIEQGSAAYNMFAAYRVYGDFNVDVATEALSRVIHDREILRTNYFSDKEGPYQVVREDIEFSIRYERVGAVIRDDIESELATRIDEIAVTPFDFVRDLMVRVSYFELENVTSEESGYLVFNVHHIACDGSSLALIVDDFSRYYGALCGGDRLASDVECLQYADYAVWQRSVDQRERYSSELEYWRSQLDQAPSAHSLALDFERPHEKNYVGDIVHRECDDILTQKLSAVAKEYEVTDFMLFHAALALLLSRHSCSNDIVVGVPVAGRLSPQVQDVVGLFVNTLALRARIDQESMDDFLAHIKQVNLEAQSNQAIPFEQVVEGLKTPRNPAYSPIFQIMLSFNTNAARSLDLSNARLESIKDSSIHAKFDLELSIEAHGDRYVLSWIYDVSLFTKERIERLSLDFNRILESVVAKPHARLRDIDMLSKSELSWLFMNGQSLPVDYPSDASLSDLIEEVASAFPTQVAVSDQARSLDYRQLNRQANQLARELLDRGVRPGHLVGLCQLRTVDMVVAVLAILKSGAGYVPLDPTYPLNRIRYMVEDSKLSIVVTHSSLSDLFTRETVVCSDLRDSYSTRDAANPGVVSDSSRIAYVIYTSGSTGNPKGVCVTHRNAISLVYWAEQAFTSKELSRVVASTSLNFDLSIFEMFVPLCLGHECVVVDSILSLTESRIEATLINTVPSAMSALLEQGGISESVRVVNLAGEPLSKDIVNDLLVRFHIPRVLNLYGPSEDTTYSTFAEFTHPIQQAPGIGSVVSNSQAYVLSPRAELLPVGVVGELCLAGDGVTQGYLGNSELTQQKFVENPFGEGRLYRTGDLVRFANDGSLCFVGRIDSQVKLNGFRIELGEIESKLALSENVKSAIVLLHRSDAGESKLTAFVVPEPDCTVESDELAVSLKATLAESLPGYMIPNVLHVLDAFPLNQNGKIDRKALAAIKTTSSAPVTLDAISPLEKSLLGLWEDLMGLDEGSVGVEDNFFELGGHSLLLSKMVFRAENQLGLKLSPKDVLYAPTVREVVARISTKTVETLPPMADVDVQDGIPLSPAQFRIWFSEQMKAGSNENNLVGGVQIDGSFSAEKAKSVLEGMYQSHDVLRMQVYLHENEPLQKVHADVPPRFKFYSFLNEEDQEARIRLLIERHATACWDIYSESLVSVILIQKTTTSWYLHVNFHHLISDGWSIALFVNEFMKRYQGDWNAVVEKNDHGAISYSGYCVWQQACDRSPELESQALFWKDYLHGCNQSIRLPRYCFNDEKSDSTNDMISATLAEDVSSGLKVIGQGCRGSLFNVLHAALGVLICRLTGERDLLIGVPVSGRHHAGIERTLGVFLNNLPFRSQVDLGLTFEDYLRSQVKNAADVLSNQDLPLERIAQQVDTLRATGRTSLFQVFLNVLNLPSTDLSSEDFRAVWDSTPEVENKFELSIYVEDREGCLELRCSYSQSLYSPGTIRTFLSQYMALLSHIAQDACQPCHRYPLQSNSPWLAALPSSLPDMSEVSSLDWSEPVHTLFERHAADNPGRLAISFDGRQWSYADVNALSNSVARRLHDIQIGKGDVVGIMAERNERLVIATLSVLKAGAAYMMLSAQTPLPRLKRQLDVVSPQCVLLLSSATEVSRDSIQLLGEIGCPLLQIDSAALVESSAIDHDIRNLDIPIDARDAAYLSFTSGTEGHPKAVLGRHSSLTVYLPWMAEKFDLSHRDRFGMLSGLLHDPIQRDMFTPLTLGAAITIPNEEEFEFSRTGEWLAKQSVSVLHLTPSLAEYILAGSRSPLPRLRKTFISGEPLTLRHVRLLTEIAPENVLVNLYGSTESSRAVSYYEVCVEHSLPDNDSQVVPVGRGVANVQLLVLNESLELCEVGELGQLGIRSEHLTLGYHQDEELTRRRYVRNPVSENDSDLIYLTGDFGRYLANGDVMCEGRKDRQVKIRGNRVELAEVERSFQEIDGVKKAVVFDVQGSGSSVQLAAFVVLESSSRALESREISQLARRQLPAHMVPEHTAIIDEVPLTQNGKIDRALLLSRVGDSVQRELIAPDNDVERTLLSICQDLLGTNDICVTDDFFDVGGHSILVTKLFMKVRQNYGVDLNYKDFFEDNSVRSVAKAIESQRLFASVADENVEKTNKMLI